MLTISCLLWYCITLLNHNTDALPNIPSEEKDPEFWKIKAKVELKRVLGKKDINNLAKNVIMFLGDGMGISTITAARIYKGQLNGQPGEETILTFEEFPNQGLAKTYNVDRQTPDSAATATAYLCGVKANFWTLGVDPNVPEGDCIAQKGREVTSILDWSKAEGKSVGIVTTARITHASPAALYAHSAARDWEGDADMEGVDGDCKDIAYQLIYDNADIEAWSEDKDARNRPHSYVWNKQQFDNVNPRNTDYLLGLFEPSHMQYELERDKSGNGEPSIAEMTQKAIQILQKNEKGFFLFVEGGTIDHAHHQSLAKKALEEVVAMDAAVQMAMKMTNEMDTLIVVTADHSHVFSIAGYPYRGNNILGVVDPVPMEWGPVDDLPYTTLIYGNGPNYNYNNRTDLTGVDTTHKDFVFPSAVPIEYETHGAEDVPIYARGPMAHLFQRTHEQNYIPHVMAYASCVGEYATDCDRPIRSVASDFLSMARVVFASILFSRFLTF
ncbi:hypothetical protein CHS0354_016360 [Potamilus streckersoni]|uniref:alkaline phosphatase n=1 Tax=Potamilus streckersoni TaxID=2493646 RepID=A0AAE0SWB7_9BIVA|nr:hypothetical protein CHS0354_016360 [Potamilus streckersoni]